MPPPDDKQAWLGKLGVKLDKKLPGGSSPAAAQLHLLADADKAKCNKYLDAHFDALAKDGAAGTATDDFQPALDGKPVAITDVVLKLFPFTLFGSMPMTPALKPSYQKIGSELNELVQARYDDIVKRKTAAAGASGNSGSSGPPAGATTGDQPWSVDLQFNANKSLFGGTAPPPYQLQLSLKWSSLSIPLGHLKSWKFATLDQPSVSLLCAPSGPCTDQAALDLITAKWLDIEKNAKLTATLQGFVGNLATKMPVAYGAQAQVELRISSVVGVQISATGTGDSSGFNVSLGLSGVLHLEAVKK